jgi:hypothetical protein
MSKYRRKIPGFRPLNKRAAMRFCGPIATQTGSGIREMKTHPDLGGHFRAILLGILAIGRIILVFPEPSNPGVLRGFPGGGWGNPGPKWGRI